MPEQPAVQPSTERGERDVVVGVVTSAKATKTITVVIDRFVKHPVFGKYMKRATTCYAHDERSEAKEGDRVEIMSSRPLSRLKRWRLVRVVEKGAREIAPAEPKAAEKKPAAKKDAAPKKESKPAKAADAPPKPKG